MSRDPQTIGTSASAKPRRRWFRFLYQFSLRTMLLGMTLAAVGCWWFLRPPVNVEELAGRYLVLQRQVRLTPVGDGSVPIAGEETGVTAITSVGWWRLLDENQDILVSGRYASDLPHGRWTLWHANGRKAAEGQAFRGGRTGLWRVWDERGTLRSEVTYRAVAPTRTGSGRTQSFYSAMGLIGPVGQMPPPYTPTAQPPPALDRYVSERHGPCRAWYASGQLHFEGEYAHDQRSGVWTFYDEQGRVIEKGPYEAGRRDGEWVVAGARLARSPTTGTSAFPRSPTTGTSARERPRSGESVTFVAGRTRAEHDALLARLAADLAGGSLRRQVAAAARLVEVGPAAVPILAAAIDGQRPEATSLALRSLGQLQALKPELLPKVEPLVDYADPRLALRAMLAVYQLAPRRRRELYPRIMALAGQSPQRDAAAEALVHICNLDADRRLLAFMSLIERLAEDRPPESNWIEPADVLAIERLQTDPAPLLTAAFGHRDPKVRVYVLLAIEQLVQSGRIERSAIQPVRDKARNDPDPEVRVYAEGEHHQAAGGFF